MKKQRRGIRQLHVRRMENLRRNANRFKRAGYTLDIMRQTACLVFNPIMVEGYAALISCTRWFKPQIQ